MCQERLEKESYFMHVQARLSCYEVHFAVHRRNPSIKIKFSQAFILKKPKCSRPRAAISRYDNRRDSLKNPFSHSTSRKCAVYAASRHPRNGNFHQKVVFPSKSFLLKTFLNTRKVYFRARSNFDLMIWSVDWQVSRSLELRWYFRRQHWHKFHANNNEPVNEGNHAEEISRSTLMAPRDIWNFFIVVFDRKINSKFWKASDREGTWMSTRNHNFMKRDRASSLSAVSIVGNAISKLLSHEQTIQRWKEELLE